MNEDKKYETIKFENNEFSLDVKISPYDKTIWLTQNDMASLFDVDKSRISRHIKNILVEGELNDSVCAETATTAQDGKKYKTKIYNLDMILTVGYRIKSKRTSIFREWALSEIDNLNNINNQKALISQYILINYDEIKLNVNVDPNEDTVWLTQNDMAILFDTTKQNISMHIKNILNDDELDNSVVKDFFTTAQDGKNYQTKMYNLDMIIAIGYRVNTKRGTIFRKWATKILKQYLLKGYVINEERCLNCTSNILSLQEQYAEINSKIKKIENTIYPEDTKLFYEGEILDAYIFIIRLFFLAKKEIIIIDPYADIFTLSMLENIKVNITIISSSKHYISNDNLDNIKIIHNDIIHDRFIIIDDIIYAIGTSINGIGKKRFIINKLEHINKELILKGII